MGKPSRGTPKDRRLTENKTTPPRTVKQQPAPKPPKPKGGK